MCTPVIDGLTFAEAERRMSQFSARCAWPDCIEWFFREDFTNYRRMFWVRWPLPAGSRACAMRAYDRAARRGLGLRLCAHAVTGDTTIAYVWAPPDPVAADHAMLGQGQLVLSVAEKRPAAHPVRYGWQLHLLKLRNRMRGFNDFERWLPSRKTGLPPG